MDDGSQARLEQLFPHLEVLAAPVRLRLSELLATPASAPAVLVQEIAELPLPTDGDVRRALRLVIEKGLGPEALAALRPRRMSDVVPLVRSCEGSSVADGYPVRMGELLRRQGATTWTELGSLTLDEMAAWTNVGPRALASMVGMAIEAALGAGTAEPVPAPTPSEDETPNSEGAALALLLDYEGAGGSRHLRGALERHASGDGPAAVRAAATRLLAAVDDARDSPLGLLDQVWKEAGDHRWRGVLAHRALRLDQPCSTKDLAHALGLSGSRVRYIQAHVEQRVRDGLAHGPEALREMTAAVRARLGPVSTHVAVGEVLASFRLPPVPDPRSLLLVWLAGPYLPVTGLPTWVATEPGALVAETRRLLWDDGGVRQLEHLRTELEAAGVAAGDVDGWLADQPVLVVDGLVVALSGSTADVAERLLSATGRAMTAAELASAAGAPGTAAALDSRLRGDGRFLRVDRDHFELAEWGSDPFTEAPPAPELFPGVGRDASAGRSQLRIEVDAAVLRGTGEPVPLAVVHALGVPRGGRRTFTTRFGPVALSHAASRASRGSVRPVALAAGARPGDALVFEFDAATGGASVELVLASNSAAS